MTRERALELAKYAQSWKAWGWREGTMGAIADAILAAVAEAVAEEREACAVIADEEASANNNSNPAAAMAEWLAAEIRLRKPVA